MTEESSFVSAIVPPGEQTEPAYWFLFRGYRLLVHLNDEEAQVPYIVDPSQLGLTAVRQQYLGYLKNEQTIQCYSAELPEACQAPEGMAFQGLRHLFGLLDENFFWLAGRALQIMDWDRTHQYCGRCSTPVQAQTSDRAKVCPQCGLTSYPRLSPAIIVRVTRSGERGPELLLARAHRHPAGFYSVLAGFVEPGETLEACVRREIKEEVGIDVKNIRYFGSQPWPFPNSLMIAFTAEYAGGHIILEDEEIDRADWFTADALPRVPPPISIARSLIDDFVSQSKP